MIPTAEEYLINQSTIKNKNIVMSSLHNGDYITKQMIEFAKLHVTEALKAASKEGFVTHKETERGDEYLINEKSIIESYPLNLIK